MRIHSVQIVESVNQDELSMLREKFISQTAVSLFDSKERFVMTKLDVEASLHDAKIFVCEITWTQVSNADNN